MGNFFRQSTSIQGLAILLGTAIGWWFGSIPLETAAASVSGALVLMGISERNSDE